jgi:hypothetical protein
MCRISLRLGLPRPGAGSHHDLIGGRYARDARLHVPAFASDSANRGTSTVRESGGYPFAMASAHTPRARIWRGTLQWARHVSDPRGAGPGAAITTVVGNSTLIRKQERSCMHTPDAPSIESAPRSP